MIKMKFKNYEKLSILIFLDTITTYIALSIGGIEYNKLSDSVLNYNYFLYGLIRIFQIIIILLIGKYTKYFENKVLKLLTKIANILILIIVFLNIIFIIYKLIGVI